MRPSVSERFRKLILDLVGGVEPVQCVLTGCDEGDDDDDDDDDHDDE